jgi:hypothetical protein
MSQCRNLPWAANEAMGSLAVMAGQLPEPGAVFLDHVAHFVPAVDAAAQALERCGFRLTEFTRQTNWVEGNPAPAGTGNRCAMLRRGYIEILAATDDTPLAQQLIERLGRHVGLHLAAFSTADAAIEHQRRRPVSRCCPSSTCAVRSLQRTVKIGRALRSPASPPG